METEKIIQGRVITPATVVRIRGLLAEHPSWHRSRLSRELCEEWGWMHVGATTGRSRNDVHATMSVPVKDVFLYPLRADFKERLCT